MNDPTPPAPVEDAHEPAAVVPPEVPEADFGARLRAAREAAGITVPTLASRMRLRVKQIDALERADLAALPSLIYVRGFVRNCARELKIDPLPLLEDLNRRAGVLPGAPESPAGSSFPLARLGDGSRSIIAISLVVLVIAGVVGTLWPRRATISPPSAARTDAPADPANAAPAPAEPSPPARDPSTDASGPAGPVPAPAGAATHAQTPATEKPGVSKGLAPHSAETAPPAAPEPLAEAAPSAPAAPDADALVLHVHAPSWVEVVQANGTSVFSQICPAGSVQTLRGVPPLRIVIGNASAVEARYHGAAVDLSRYANVNGVARFTLQ